MSTEMKCKTCKTYITGNKTPSHDHHIQYKKFNFSLFYCINLTVLRLTQGGTSVGKVMNLIESAKPNSADHIQAIISFGL